MKRGFVIGSLLAVGCLVFLPSLSTAQTKEAPEFAYGTVKSISPEQIVISEYDDTKDEETDTAYTIDQKTELKNANSLKDIAVGANVDITYLVSDGKNVAQSISVEEASEEDAITPEEQAPQAK